MYRLIKGISLQAASSVRQCTPRVCVFCNFLHRNESAPTIVLDGVLIRRHTSSTNNVILSSAGKRKFKKKNKKYAELLEVTESTTNNRKAAVQNLSAAQLSVLVDQPDITLDKLHKIRNKHSPRKRKNGNKFTFSTNTSEILTNHQIANSPEFANTFDNNSVDRTQNKKDVEEDLTEDLETSGMIDETMLIKSSSLAKEMCESNQEIVINSEIENLEKSRENDIEEKVIDKERKSREAAIYEEKSKQFNKILLGYINVCMNCIGKLNVEHLLNYLGKTKWKKNQNKIKKKLQPDLYCINQVFVYNAQIEKLASIGYLKSILEILEVCRSCNIKLNSQTYAHVFECIGRMTYDNGEKISLLKQIKSEMDSEEISLNDVVTKSLFVRDQRTYVENMVKLLDEQFKPSYQIPDTAYDCRLLENLTQECAAPSSTIEGLLQFKDLEDRLKKQMEIEINGQVSVRNISTPTEVSQSVIHWRNKLSNLEKTWEKLALNAFQRNLTILRKHEMFSINTRMALHPYLSILRPEDYVRILLTEVRKLGMGSEMYSLPVNSLCHHVGMQVYKMYEAKLKQSNGINDKIAQVYLQYCDWFLKRDDKHNCRSKWALLEHEANKTGVTLGAELPSWQNHIQMNIGRFLYNIMLNDFKIDVNYSRKKKGHHGHYSPAFYKIFRHSGVMLKEEIKPHPMLAKLYRDSQPETLMFDTTLIPSICPPRPWVSISSGGYIISKTNIVRITSTENQQWDRLMNAPPKKLYPALDSLNQLGSIPWTVNQSVLDVAIEVFQKNGSVELNMPQPPSVLAPIPPAPKDSDPDEKKKIDRARIELKRRKNEMYSLWCDALYRLSLANHFRNNIFWLPHNMDFRGRVYPIPPHLNHLGSDLARSMLVFALKKPLGSNGLNWLKLHCINLTGFKKRDPISERLKYADDVLDKILDSAEKPLTGERWWSTSDEPWQTLAACMEIAAALKLQYPEQYMSGFPIHQDGSCNGLQHYAALGRDQIGAESVNLHPSDVPQDVYSSVATMVDERRKEDAANGNHIAQILEGFIKRKVIKQTVMTTVYGVTWFGAKLQIARQLKDVDDFPQEHLWPASTYLVHKTFQTLRTMFKSAREIQDWFTECARLVCVARQENMEWLTPLSLPVIQPYSKINYSSKKSSTPSFSSDILRRPNVMKQKNAFAPNFVHSLDSSHMMLTSINSEHKGITFVSVHDCYWTHPCTVEIMNKICREQFVALHSEPILEDLSKFLIDKFGYNTFEMQENEDEKNGERKQKKLVKNPFVEELNSTLTKVPKQGDFDLKGVLSSTYFFS